MSEGWTRQIYVTHWWKIVDEPVIYQPDRSSSRKHQHNVWIGSWFAEHHHHQKPQWHVNKDASRLLALAECPQRLIFPGIFLHTIPNGQSSSLWQTGSNEPRAFMLYDRSRLRLIWFGLISRLRITRNGLRDYHGIEPSLFIQTFSIVFQVRDLRQ